MQTDNPSIEELDAQLDQQVESLLSQQETPQERIPMERTQAEDPPATTTTEQQKQEHADSVEAFLKLHRKGEEVAVGEEEARRLAQQGWDYQEKMRGLKSERREFESTKEQWETQRDSYQQRIDEYQAVDEWAKANPESWAQIVQQTRGGSQPDQGHSASPYVTEKINELQSKLEQTTTQLSELSRAKQEERRKAEDAALDKAIADYKASRPEQDWEAKDSEGLTLEQRIIQHAADDGIGTFKAAANDYLVDKISKRAEMSEAEKEGEKIQREHAEGIVTKKISTTDAFQWADTNKTYEELEQEALRELGSS